MERLGEEAFMNCKTQHLEVPSKITRIPRRAFASGFISSLLFRGKVVSIGEDAFRCSERH